MKYIFVLLCFLPCIIVASNPKYETVYACEGRTLVIKCEEDKIISLVRANYGRFSIAICNDHGNTEWRVNCMSPKSLRVLSAKCESRQSCSVPASTALFGDPCPNTHKYLEAHYQCLSASQTTTTTNRPNPPWLVTSQPSVLSTSTVRNPTTARVNINNISFLPTDFKFEDVISRVDTTTQPSAAFNDKTIVNNTQLINDDSNKNSKINKISSQKPQYTNESNSSSNTHFSTISDVSTTTSHYSTIYDPIYNTNHSTQATVLINNSNESSQINQNPLSAEKVCPSVVFRNITWNRTKMGETIVKKCPDGAIGMAKWKCVNASLFTVEQKLQLFQQQSLIAELTDKKSDISFKKSSVIVNGSSAMWQTIQPDLSQCRSVWLQNLEERLKLSDSPLISIASEVAMVTNSKNLYGGDILLTTKIIQAMIQRMIVDVNTFPDQREKESIVLELLHGVVKTISNLLDGHQYPSWLDISFEEQMIAATSLLTNLEENAFLVANSLSKEKNVVQKAKNIILTIRVLETRNIDGNEVFPDSTQEHWHVSDNFIELPRGSLIENSDTGLVRIVFIAFDRLESLLNPAQFEVLKSSEFSKPPSLYYNKVDEGNSSFMQKQRVINSKIISASLGSGRHIELSSPVRLVLKHIRTENVTNPVCVFWSFVENTWSREGCYVDTTNSTHTSCFCNHLTNFAVLMDIDDTLHFSSLSSLDQNIKILMIISIFICIIFIIIAILTLRIFSGIFMKTSRAVIYKNLYSCLLTIEILFLIGIELDDNSMAWWLCGFTSAFLHCSFISAVAWMFIEGFHLYIILTTDDMILEVEKCSRILWYYLLTYGLSFMIVAIALAIDPVLYTKAEYCVWIDSTTLFYFTFVMPISLFIFANIVYSALSLHLLCGKYKQSGKNKEHNRLSNNRWYLRCSFIFLIIFSVDWIFGYLYMRNTTLFNNGDKSQSSTLTIIYGYLFILLNTFQGIYIFVFHCLQNDTIRCEYGKFLQRQKWFPQCLKCFETKTVPPHQQVVVHSHDVDNSLETNRDNNIDVLPIDESNILRTYQPTSRGTMLTVARNSNMRPNPCTKKVFEGHLSTGQNTPSSSTGSSHLIYNQSNCVPMDAGFPRDENMANVNDMTTMNKYAYYEHNRNNKHKHYGNNISDENEFYLNNHQNIKDDIRLHRRESSDSSSSGIIGSNLAYKPQYTVNSNSNNQGIRRLTSSDDDQNPEARVLMHDGRRRKFVPSNTLQIDKRITTHRMPDTATIVNYGRHYYHQQQAPSFNNANDEQEFSHNDGEEPVYEEILGNIRNLQSSYSHASSDNFPLRMNENVHSTLNIENQLASRGHVVPTYGDFCSDFQKPSRNLSAVLNDNNTVVCFLEPLPSQQQK